MTSAAQDSLRNLGLERMAVMNLRLGGPREASIAEPLRVLLDLQKQGLIRHLGLSNVTATQVAEGRAMAEIVCVQNQYNLAHRQDDALIDELAGVGIAYTPFSR